MKCLYDCSFRDADHYVKKHMEKYHDYCRKCDARFDDWAALAQHRIASNRHFACAVCASDFKSAPGLKRHVELEHPIDQKAKCLGCSEEFYSMARMIHHLEQGECPVITAKQFASHVQHKQLVAAMLGDIAGRATLGTGYSDAAIDNDEGGGVTLLEGNPLGLDRHEPEPETHLAVHAALEPAKRANSDYSRFEEFPALFRSRLNSSASVSSTAGTLSRLSISGGIALPASDPPSSATSTVGNTSRSVWDMDKPASSVLGKGAKLTPVTAEWLQRENEKDAENSLAHGPNLLRTRFWDPRSDAFQTEEFFDPIIEKYICPFSPCDIKFMTPVDLVTHIEKGHRSQGVRCPNCSKYFKTTASLVAHCEAPASKCKIRHTDKYKEAMYYFTGGFVEANEGLHPEAPTRVVHEFKKVRNREGQKIEKLAKTHIINHHVWNYSATTPTDWEQGEEKRRIEYKQSKDREGFENPHQHINISARFDGGYPQSNNVFRAQTTTVLAGAAHGNVQDGLRTEQEDHEAFRMVDPDARQKRTLWADLARDNDSVTMKLESVDNDGSSSVDDSDY